MDDEKPTCSCQEQPPRKPGDTPGPPCDCQQPAAEWGGRCPGCQSGNHKWWD